MADESGLAAALAMLWDRLLPDQSADNPFHRVSGVTRAGVAAQKGTAPLTRASAPIAAIMPQVVAKVYGTDPGTGTGVTPINTKGHLDGWGVIPDYHPYSNAMDYAVGYVGGSTPEEMQRSAQESVDNIDKYQSGDNQPYNPRRAVSTELAADQVADHGYQQGGNGKVRAV